MTTERELAGAAGEPRVQAIVFPQDGNPYQRVLYEACEANGMSTCYAGELTRSRTLNLLLLPLELVSRRLRGWNVLHLHWTYAFWLPASKRIPLLYRVASAWFLLVLLAARASGLRIAWTAHNVLPHQRVFHDDVAMQRWLVRLSHVVIVHSLSAERELSDALERPSCLAVIPHPPFALAAVVAGQTVTGPLRLLFFGRVATYKGVEDLLVAMERASVDLRLTVAGVCDDPRLSQRIVAAARPLGERVSLRLEHISEDELPGLLAQHDLLVLPFRRTTTSGSALLGLGAGIPVAAPDFSAFEDMPILRFEPGVDGLTQFLESLSDYDREELRRLGDVGAKWAASQLSWSDVGAATARTLRAAVRGDCAPRITVGVGAE